MSKKMATEIGFLVTNGTTLSPRYLNLSSAELRGSKNLMHLHFFQFIFVFLHIKIQVFQVDFS